MQLYQIFFMIFCSLASIFYNPNVAAAASAQQYQYIDKLPSYKLWLTAPTPSLKNEAALSVFDEIEDEYEQTDDDNKRAVLLSEEKQFLYDNKDVVDVKTFASIEQGIQQTNKKEEAYAKRHAARRQIPPQLEAALKAGDVKAVFAHLNKHRDDYQAVDKYGNNPLMVALAQEQWSIPLIDQLIQRTKNLNARNDEQKTALHLVAYSADPKAADFAKRLINRGARLEVKDMYGFTPLMNAVRWGQSIPVIDVLLRHKADPKVTDSVGTPLISLALHRLGFCKQCNRVHTLQEQQAVVTLLLQFRAPLNTSKRAPLFDAIGYCDGDMVGFLINNGAEANLENNGESPLSYAISIYRDMGDTSDMQLAADKKELFAIIELLLQAGADKNAKSFGVTPLESAVYAGSVQLAQLLLQYGANIEPALTSAQNALAYGVQAAPDPERYKEQLQQIIAMLKKHSDEYTKSAGYQENVKAKEALIEQHILPSAGEISAALEGFLVENTHVDVTKMNTLKEALRTNNKELFDKTISVDVLELTDEAGDSPLQLAVKYNRPDEVEAILQMLHSLAGTTGSLLNRHLEHKNKQEFTALEIAQELGLNDISKLLEDAARSEGSL